MRRRLFLVPAVMLLALVGCSESGREKEDVPNASPSPAAPFTLALTASAGGDKVTVHGTTNLPDGTLVTVLLARNVRFKGEDPRAFHAGGDGVSVKGGKFESDIQLKEDLLRTTVTLPPGQTGFGPLESISNTLSVCAQVRPNDESEKPQPKGVQEALGNKGANLKSSPEATKFGDGYRLETLTSLELPTPSLAAIEGELGKVKTVVDATEDLFCVS